MFYYLVWVRSNRYHGSKPLTYSSATKLSLGNIIRVELQKLTVLGFVVEEVSKPKFKTKPIKYIYDLPPLPGNLIELASWLIKYYPAPLGIISQQFLPANIPLKFNRQTFKAIKPLTSVLPSLNDDQTKAIKAMAKQDTYILHGRTGTGKTRIYIEEAIKTLDKGKSVIILSPEIGLSSQLFDNFHEVFKNQVITIHSKQAPKERQQAWLTCLTAKIPLVVIGPRSALFSPLKDVGLIVVDEEHDSAYKQDQLPRYQTVRVASALAQLAKAKLILGSATPLISDYFLAIAKSRPIVELTKLAKGPSTKATVKIIDLKNRDNFINSTTLSDPLIESIKTSLESGEQSLIFLNRRGTSRLILCDNCGWEALCPNCNLPLVYHGDLHHLRCHSCGYIELSIPSICPICDSDSILYTTMGTKAVVDEVKKFFPTATIHRFDTDNSKSTSLGQLYKSIIRGDIDILIGTQQLAKGFDLPKLSTVGILQADTSLYIPDFSSEERSFELITQVLGRISRGHVSGRAVIQTYNPNSNLLKTAIEQDYKAFYSKEILNREKFKFPPYYSLLKITCLRKSAKSAEQSCQKLKTLISQNFGVQVEGPAPAFHEQHRGKYQWQLVVKSTNRTSLIAIIDQLPSGWTYDLDPSNLL